jgi:hypothetical protein
MKKFYLNIKIKFKNVGKKRELFEIFT